MSKPGPLNCLCGGEPVRRRRTQSAHGGQDKWVWLECSKCKLRGPEDFLWADRYKYIELWNEAILTCYLGYEQL